MANPTIAPSAGGGQTVTASKEVSIHLFLRELIDESAVFKLECPQTGTTVTLAMGAGPPLPLATAAPPTSGVVDGRNVTCTLSADTPIPGVVTLQVTVQGGGPTTQGYALLKAVHASASNYTIDPVGTNTDIVRVLADPTITTVALGTLKDRDEISLSGTVAHTQFVMGAPPAGLPALPALGAKWSQASGAAATIVGPTTFAAGTATAKTRAPVVYGSTPLTYRLRGSYDTVTVNGIPDPGEPFNDGEMTVTVQPRNHHMILVLDRSGSMLSTMGGATFSKWEYARRAAHVWADLYVAFREDVTGAAPKGGIEIFESTACSWGPASSPVQILLPATGNPGPLANLSVPILTLGSPGSCTPIGDALIAAMDKFAAPGFSTTATDDRYILVLMTDGYENSGRVVVEDDNPVPAGAVGTFAAQRPLGGRQIVSDRLTLFTIGLGPPSGVQEFALSDLPNAPAGGVNPPNGLYRLVTAPGLLLDAFADMLGYALDARKATATTITGGVGTFTLEANEHRLAVVVQWDTSTDEIRLYWRPVGGSYTQISGTGAVATTGVTFQQREKHGIVTVKLAQALGTSNGAGSEWKVERWAVGGIAPASIGTGQLLPMVDLSLLDEVSFDRTQYRTGEPIQITCPLRTPSDAVSGATITVELARPGESLGTFLATNGARYRPRQQSGPDPAHPKLAMLQQLLQQRDMSELPTVTPPSIFDDGTNVLHELGAANTGDYANVYSKTDKEGTYTWRFTISGESPDGGTFSRETTISKWVGVQVDPASSPVTVNSGLPAPGGSYATRIAVLPLDRRREYLGPFRASDVTFQTTAGQFKNADELGAVPDGIVYPQPDGGAMISHYDGHYSRVLVFRKSERPTVTVIVQGQRLRPVAVAPGLLARIWLWIRELLLWPLRLFGLGR